MSSCKRNSRHCDITGPVGKVILARAPASRKLRSGNTTQGHGAFEFSHRLRLAHQLCPERRHARAPSPRRARHRGRRILPSGPAGHRQPDLQSDQRRHPARPPKSSPNRFWTDSLAVQAAWELDFWGKFRRGFESADAAYLASIANYDQVLVTLLGDVAATISGSAPPKNSSRSPAPMSRPRVGRLPVRPKQLEAEWLEAPIVVGPVYRLRLRISR
jgi:hypothetical protein